MPFFYHAESDAYLDVPDHKVDELFSSIDGSRCVEINANQYHTRTAHMPFPAKAPITPAAPVYAVGGKVFVKDPELAQQYPADIIKIDGDMLSLALYQGPQMKRPALSADDALVDVPKSGVTLAALIGLPTVGYGEQPASAAAPAAAPSASVPTGEAKATFTDVVTINIPGFSGSARGDKTMLIIKGKPARQLLNFDGSPTGFVVEVANDALIAMALDKPYCDRVVSMVEFWDKQVKAGALPGIGEGQQTIPETESKKRGRRTNAQIAADKAAEAGVAPQTPAAATPVATQPAAAPVTTSPVPSPATIDAAVGIAETARRLFWMSMKAQAETELAKA